MLTDINLSFIHDPVGARSNLYTTEIAYPTLSYLTSDYLVIKPSFLWERVFSKGIVAGAELGYGYVKPFRINYINNNTSVSLADINKSVYLKVKVAF